jgi:hypothetical protein
LQEVFLRTPRAWRWTTSGRDGSDVDRVAMAPSMTAPVIAHGSGLIADRDQPRQRLTSMHIKRGALDHHGRGRAGR